MLKLEENDVATLLTAAAAGRRLRPPVSAARMRQLADEGRVQPLRTENGLRLFRPEDIDRLSAERGRS